MTEQTWKQKAGPSLLHAVGALVITGFVGGIASILMRNGVHGTSLGAAVASTWFWAREVCQVAPHWGWKSWALNLTTQQRDRLVRQALYPTIAAVVVPVLIAFLR